MTEWVVEIKNQEALEELRGALEASARLIEKMQAGAEGILPGVRIAFEVARFKNLKVFVWSDEHPPPHFRVKANGESADYTIEDCTPITKGLERYYRVIRKWHAKNQELLITTWDERRPTGCTVGPYRRPDKSATRKK